MTEEEKNTGRRRYSEEERAMVVGLYRESGLSRKEFCRREGIKEVNLHRWIKKVGSTGNGGEVKWVELENMNPKPKAEARYRVGLACGGWVEVGNEFQGAVVSELLGIVREAARC